MTMNKGLDRAKYIKEFNTLSDEVKKSPLAEPWEKALKYLYESDYFRCPASTRFHLCCESGLLAHSVSVVKVALQTHANYGGSAIRPCDIIASGLLHDIGKCGLIDNGLLRPRYPKNPEPFPKWPKAQKWWGPYTYQDTKPMFTIRDLSALLVARFGFPWGIVQAVLIHDGAYVEANKEYSHGLEGLSLVLMTADTLHAQGMETNKDSYDEIYL